MRTSPLPALALAALFAATPVSALEKAIGPQGEVELVPLADPTTWVTADDYPAEALRLGQGGKVSMVLTIAADGVPRSCKIDQTSGSPSLDEQSCSLLMQRALHASAELY